jgi:2-oxoglutarate dehydrogenase E1 component
VAIVRVEQLYPWPRGGVQKALDLYPHAEVLWCQEEPANMGSWSFVQPRIEYVLQEDDSGKRPTPRPLYVGRPASASPATGHLQAHLREQALLVEQALTWRVRDLGQPFRRLPGE